MVGVTHYKGGYVPGPDPFEPVDHGAYMALPHDVRNTLDQHHRGADRLQTALESVLNTYPHREKEKIRLLIFRCLGLTVHPSIQ